MKTYIIGTSIIAIAIILLSTNNLFLIGLGIAYSIVVYYLGKHRFQGFWKRFFEITNV